MSFVTTVTTFAEAIDAQGGAFGALGLDIRSFIFQLITFVLVLLILRKYAFPTLVKTLEDRRIAVEKSIDQAKQTEQSMQKAEKQIEALLREARGEAEELVAAGQREAAKMIEDAEVKAVKRAEHVVKEAKTHMDQELRLAREELKHETARLVAEATSIIVKEKVDAKKNASLIRQSITSAKERA